MRNRLDRSQEPGSHINLFPAPQQTKLSDTRSVRSDNTVAFFGPERYEPRYEYPLIVWLHSCRSNEREIEDVMPVLSMQNYVACAPRGPMASESKGQRFVWPQSRAATAVAEESIFAAIASASEHFSIAERRIFLAGFGSGGTMAWRIALRYPQQFAGVVSICGQFPSKHRPLTNLAGARQLPALWMFGQDSTECGIEHVCDVLPLMHAARMSACIRQYPCQDELLSNMLSDMNHWLMEQVTNQPSQRESTVEESFSKN